ncbi:MAG TPA: hypothetical protein VFT62_07575 [Mycobacteriales bacterium]|nr:hypothetical protein [Mycobacteriales bacterium]
MAAASALRDELTRQRLTRAGAHLPGLEVLAFTPDWWDGQAHTPCLVIRGGRLSRRQRIVETGGECVIVPFDRRHAERQLARRRQPGRPELTVPAQRPAEPVVVDAYVDVVRCTGRACGALLPVDYEGACPVCGVESDWWVDSL